MGCEGKVFQLKGLTWVFLARPPFARGQVMLDLTLVAVPMLWNLVEQCASQPVASYQAAAQVF